MKTILITIALVLVLGMGACSSKPQLNEWYETRNDDDMQVYFMLLENGEIYTYWITNKDSVESHVIFPGLVPEWDVEK